jgi:hypothetical protein
VSQMILVCSCLHASSAIANFARLHLSISKATCSRACYQTGSCSTYREAAAAASMQVSAQLVNLSADAPFKLVDAVAATLDGDAQQVSVKHCNIFALVLILKMAPQRTV